MGRLVVNDQPGEHVCRPPGPMIPPGWADAPAGSRYFCDCGQVWIVRWTDMESRHAVGISHNQWFPESRRERRRRLRKEKQWTD